MSESKDAAALTFSEWPPWLLFFSFFNLQRVYHRNPRGGSVSAWNFHQRRQSRNFCHRRWRVCRNKVTQYRISVLSRIRTECWVRLLTEVVLQTADSTAPASTETLFAPNVTFIRTAAAGSLHIWSGISLVGCARPGEQVYANGCRSHGVCVTLALRSGT